MSLSPTPSRRSFLATVAATPVVLSGCLDSEETFRLDPDDFEDEYLHLVAEGVTRTDLELVSLIRDDEGWIRADLRHGGPLEEHLDIPPDINVPTPIPPEYRSLFVRPPGYEPIVEWYARAVEAGEQGEGLALNYEGQSACTGRTTIARNRFEWYLDDQIRLTDIKNEVLTHYSIEC